MSGAGGSVDPGTTPVLHLPNVHESTDALFDHRPVAVFAKRGWFIERSRP